MPLKPKHTLVTQSCVRCGGTTTTLAKQASKSEQAALSLERPRTYRLNFFIRQPPPALKKIWLFRRKFTATLCSSVMQAVLTWYHRAANLPRIDSLKANPDPTDGGCRIVPQMVHPKCHQLPDCSTIPGYPGVSIMDQIVGAPLSKGLVRVPGYGYPGYPGNAGTRVPGTR
eukprot:148333-Rhodomonas_salina.1